MIKKETILKIFNEDDAKEAIKVYEKYKLAYEKDIPLFTNSFSAPNIWSFFEKSCCNMDFLVEANGIFEESERRMISFNNSYNIEYPIKVLEICNKSNFSNLEHRDYLGAILALGIDRNKLGDILVRDKKAYVPVLEEIYQYILNNLSNIGKSPVEIDIIENISNLPSANFEEIVINIASLRIDSVVAKMANISRTRAIELIDSGKVLINYVKVKDKSQDILKDYRVTIRGIGKFIIGDVIGGTRSGKQRVIIKKYI